MNKKLQETINRNGQEGWRKNKHQHAQLFVRKKRKSRMAERVDKDGLSWEDRQRIEDIKNRNTYGGY